MNQRLQNQTDRLLPTQRLRKGLRKKWQRKRTKTIKTRGETSERAFLLRKTLSERVKSKVQALPILLNI